jgi:hypothetical protein
MAFARLASVGCLLTAAILSGCSGDQGPQRAIVSGTVTFNGKPIANGRISFVPDRNTAAPTAVALIVDGKFVVDSRGGVPVGTHRVQIEAYRPVAGQTGGVLPPTATVPGVGPQYLPAKYNANSQLTITIQSSDRAITKNFDLTD